MSFPRSSLWPAVGVLAGTVMAGLGYRLVFGSRSQLFGAFPFRDDLPGNAGDDQPRVALSFDDGPNEPDTSRLLDLLGERGVPATFFQVGRCAERHPEVTRRVVAEGHVLANHSYDHAFRSYAADPGQRDQVARGRQALAEIAGVTPALYRPPWLCHLPWVLRGIAAERSQVVSGTFVHPFEVFQPAARRIVAGALRAARPGAILIAHDGREARGGDRSQTVAAVAPLIDGLLAREYAFTTVDRLLGVPPYA